jgi:two-component system, OmpR family, response regulator
MRILLVEDESKIATSIKKGLEQETYSVDIALNGQDGYDLATTEEYDVIILDWMLPGMNGGEICTKLRQEESKVPILILTAKSEVGDKVLGLNSGADDYLTKPFAFEELLARIKSLLRRPANYLSTEFSCDDLTLDINSYLVKRENTEISLSRREFALLEYLLRNEGKTVSKDQITAHVWDYDSDILPNTVEQYIGYLRTKIDKYFPHKKPLIKTVRGFGYTISCK